MMNILLVEPGYKNKYPPLGLMKISSYHKSKGDSVTFVKGCDNKLANRIWDRIYIATLFTFDFNITIETIRYYKSAVNKTSHIYAGGVLASLMPERVKQATGIENVVCGRLLDSAMLGFSDKVNIDNLSLDYEILDSIRYRYPAGDNYFGYTTRGCPNHCAFCAVPKLEPKFETTNHIYEQVMNVNKIYGEKKDLLLLDNNVLHSPDLENIVSDIIRAGFICTPNFIKPTQYETFRKRAELRPFQEDEITAIINWSNQFKQRVRDKEGYLRFEAIFEKLKNSVDPEQDLRDSDEEIMSFVHRYKSKSKSQRHVDFNQGIDARLLNDTKMEILSRIPIRPLRIAFDSVDDQEIYQNAVVLAHRYGIRQISNYMLYNFKDKPEDLWTRLKINLDIKQQYNLDIFSFPMKYIPITHTDRNYIGQHWNKKLIRAVQAILLVKKGIVSTHLSFFEKAFGKNVQEYLQILMMPEDFIIYRFEYEKNGMAIEWKRQYQNLDDNERTVLTDAIKNNRIDGELFSEYSDRINRILEFYKIKHK